MPSVQNEKVSFGTDTALVGKQFGPYRVLSLLGHGGMGSVWLAERTDGLFKRQVALKLIHAALVSRGSSWCSGGTQKRCLLRRSRLMDAVLSQQPWTRQRASGTPRLGSKCSCWKGMVRQLRTQLSHPMDAGSSPRPTSESAGAPYDPDRRAPGVASEQIVGDIAIQACGTEHISLVGEPRWVYEHGRALMATGDFPGARHAFERAIDGRYRALRGCRRACPQ